MSILCYPLFLLYKLLNMFRATMCPSSGADDCVVLPPRVGVVPWLQVGCQNRLAGSVSVHWGVRSCSHHTTCRVSQVDLLISGLLMFPNSIVFLPRFVKIGELVKLPFEVKCSCHTHKRAYAHTNKHTHTQTNKHTHKQTHTHIMVLL